MNTLPCGDCAHWRGPISTQERRRLPLGYCDAWATYRLRTEVVEDCTKALDEGPQQASDAK